MEVLQKRNEKIGELGPNVDAQQQRANDAEATVRRMMVEKDEENVVVIALLGRIHELQANLEFQTKQRTTLADSASHSLREERERTAAALRHGTWWKNQALAECAENKTLRAELSSRDSEIEKHRRVARKREAADVSATASPVTFEDLQKPAPIDEPYHQQVQNEVSAVHIQPECKRGD